MKKLLISFLCVVMVMVFMPTMAFAGATGEKPYTEADYGNNGLGARADQAAIISEVRNNLFHDQILATAVLVAIDENMDADASLDWLPAMRAITKIDLPYASTMHHKIEDLEGIQNLFALKKLNLSGHDIEDLGPLSDNRLANLEEIDLSNNEVLKNLAPLGLVAKLKVLNVSGNAVEELAPLGKLQNLTTLDASDNNIKNLGGIEKATTLTDLNVSGNKIEDLGGISKLTNLIDLNVANNDIQNLGALVGLTKITTLDLSANNIEDLKEVSKLAELVTLNISDNKVQDVSWLKDLEHLTKLYVTNNSIEDFSKLPAGVNVAGKDEQVTFELVVSETAKVVEGGTVKVVESVVLPEDGKLVVKSDNTAVATVAADGTVTGVKAGTAKIEVSVVKGDKVLSTKTCTVTVTAKEHPVKPEPKPEVPKTGDMNTMLPWLAVMALAAGAAVVLKRREN